MNYRVMKNYEPHLPEPTPGDDLSLKNDDTVLLIRLSAIGDAVRLLPVVKYLRSTGFTGPIDIATQPPIDSLLKLHPGVRQVHSIRRDYWPSHPIQLFNNLTTLRRSEYDWVFDAHGLLKSAVVSRFANGKHRIGWDKENNKEFNHWFQNRTVPALPETMPRILKYTELVRYWGGNTEFTRDQLGPVGLDYPELNRSVKLCADEHPIVIHPRTSHGRYGTSKEWSPGKFKGLIRDLLTVTSRRIRLTWGPGERETAETIAEPFDQRVTPSPETPSLPDLAYLIDQAHLVISLDTAPCHMADVLGTPLVAIFGSSDHHVSGPLITDYRLITTRGKEEETEDIPVSRVSKATRDLLRTI